MQTIRLQSQVSQDGLLQVQLPDHHGEELEILIVYQPVTSDESTPHKRQWSSTFLQAFGAWQGDPLTRAAQEEQAERLPFFE